MAECCCTGRRRRRLLKCRWCGDIRIYLQHCRGVSLQKMHHWLGRSVGAVLSFIPPGRAWPGRAEVSPNWNPQMGRNVQCSPAVVDCCAQDPSSSAPFGSGDHPELTLPTETIFSAAKIFVVHPPYILGWFPLRRHASSQQVPVRRTAPLVRSTMSN